MTVITKPISEKKSDKLDQPLVTAECLPNKDVEGGLTDSQSVDPRILVLRARAHRASSVTTACLLLMALLVMCCGILGGFYMYNQFIYSQVHQLRGWCRIPYNDQDDPDSFLQAMPEFQEFRGPKSNMHFVNEEFDIDGDANSYEKITVPTFDGGRSSRFIHDFNANKTGIIDVEGHRCFVMPLNRSQVLPPRDLIDLVRKMWEGYYDVDTKTVQESMTVVLPPIKDLSSVGMYIERECVDYPIYKLERSVIREFKRSVAEEPVMFTYFSGKSYLKLAIVNEKEMEAYEQEHNSHQT